jgi:tetratricopeptide (TPR) repeat protein
MLLLTMFGVSMAVVARHLAQERNRANREAERANQEARAAQQGAKVLSELVNVDLGNGIFDTRTLDPKEVERVVATLESRWPDRPEATALLLEKVGASLASAGIWDAAIRLLERAGEIRRDVVHDPNWDAIGARIFLGEYYVVAGRLRDADAVFERIVSRLRAGPAATPTELGYALENLGCTRRDLGRYAEAEFLLREALANYAAVKPNWQPYLASAHDSLGTLFLATGDLERAEAEHREAMRLRDAFSPWDMNRVRSSYMLGLVLVRRGKTAEAGPLLQSALGRRATNYGPDSAEVAVVQDALGELYLTEGRLDHADDALGRALKAFEASLPEDNPAHATALVHLGELRSRQGRAGEAREALLRATAIRERVLGADHDETIRAHASLAALDQGRRL